MIIVLSPSKALDFSPSEISNYSQPRLLDESQRLIDTVSSFNPEEVSHLMSISEKLGLLNWQRFQDFQRPFSLDNAKQALLAFKGDVYTGIETESYTDEDFNFAQNHLRILSGLYGLLRPMDIIQPYRLEMGTRLKNDRGNNLYQFWGQKIADLMNQDQAEIDSAVLVNLASNEYFKAVAQKTLKARVLTLAFKENKSGQFKTIGIHAKKARGMMTNFIIKNRLTDPETFKEFDVAGYAFNPGLSSQDEWVFSR